MLSSIIIRTYNSTKYIEKAITSAMSQTLAPDQFEIIVIDDGSTDNTPHILESFQDRIHCILTPHVGAIRAANIGINAAQGQYVSFLDADDIYSNDFLTKMIKTAQRENANLVVCDYWEMDENGNKKLISCLDNIFNSVLGNLLFQKQKILEAGLFNEDIIFPEYDLLLKKIEEWNIVYEPSSLFCYIRHHNSITSNKNVVKNGFQQLYQMHSNKFNLIKKIRQY